MGGIFRRVVAVRLLRRAAIIYDEPKYVGAARRLAKHAKEPDLAVELLYP